MRPFFAALLLVAPLLLLGWVQYRGAHPPQRESLAAAAPSEPPLRGVFASPVAGASAKGEVALYDPQNLFDYLDGGAPRFIDRQFRRLAAAELAVAEGGELACDVYDMSNPAGAAAIFQAERSGGLRDVEGWPEAAAGPLAFVFTQGRYYVKLTAFDPQAEAKLAQIAAAVRGRLP